MSTKKEKVTTFIKEHKKGIIIGVAAIATVAVCGSLAINHKTPLKWEDIAHGGGSKVRSAHKWIGDDEWKGVVHAGLHKVTLDEFDTISREILVNGGLSTDTVIEEIVFITSKDE